MVISSARQRLLVRAAVMYYKDECTHKEMAIRLGVSRATAGRLVAEARSVGIVQVRIVSGLSRQVESEVLLERVFGLDEAVVIDREASDIVGDLNLGQGCADILSRRIAPGNVVGLGWSSDPHEWIASTAEVLAHGHWGAGVGASITIVQLAGAAPAVQGCIDPMRTVSSVAGALGASEILIPAPLYVDSEATVKSLRADRGIRTALEAAAWADICMFGVGHVTESTPLFVNGYLRKRDLSELRAAGAVGDIAGRFFDGDGRPIGGDLASRTLSLDLEVLRDRPLRIAAAAGPDRVDALLGALRGSLANALVTDIPTAKALVERHAEMGRRTKGMRWASRVPETSPLLGRVT